MRDFQLRQIATGLKTGVGQSRAHGNSERGYWQDIAEAAELLAHATTVANTNVAGSVQRTVAAFETLASTTVAGAGVGYRGKLKRIIAALEGLNSATYAGSLEQRIVLAVAAFTYPAILGALTITPSTVTKDDAGTSISIVGATAASTLTSTALPAGLTLNSGPRTITGTPTAAGATAVTLTETLAGALNTPKDSAVSIIVAP